MTMADLKLKGFVDEDDFQKLIELDRTVERVRANYASAAKELAKGLKINVEGIADLEKLHSIYTTQSKNASSASNELTEALKKQSEISQTVAKRIEEKLNVEKLSTAEIAKENTRKNESYQIDKRAIDIARSVLGTREQNLSLLRRFSKQLKDNSAEQKKVNDLLGKGEITKKEAIKRSQELLSAEIALKQSKQGVRQALVNEEKLTRSLEGSYDEMSHSLEMMRRAYKQMDDVERDSINGKILVEEIQKADKQLKAISASMGEYQRNVGNYASALDAEYVPAIKEALGLNNTFADSILKLSEAGEGGEGFFDNLSIKTKAFSNTLLTLLKNPVFLSIAGIATVGATFKFWYDYNKGLVEASRLTTQFTGLHGDEMKQYRNEVQAVADTFEVDFKETLIAANSVAKQFGIAQSDALGLIKDGFIAGANANGYFLDNLKEYPAYFKEAGLSADQFIAIATQTNQSGIYSDKGIDTIKEGNIRIREMTNATADALDGIGISSKKVLEDLRNGNTTTFEVMQKVSEKLNELPDSSAAVGTAIADIFGGPGEDAGLQYIRTLKDIDTNLDSVKDNAGALGKLQEKQMNSQIELENAISSLFDATGGGFESMTTSVSVFVNKALASMINGIRDVIGWFQELYDKSMMVRGAISFMKLSFESVYDFMKFFFRYSIANFEVLGSIIKAAFTLDFDAMEQGVKRWKDTTERLTLELSKSMKDNLSGAIDDVVNKKRPPLKIVAETDIKTNNSMPSGKTKSELEREKKAREEAAKEAKRQLKIRHDLEDSKIELMDEGLEKELAKIRQGYIKKIDAITGNSNAEKIIRLNLEKQMQNELQKYEQEYVKQFELKNIENKLIAVEKGSKEELDLKLQQLALQRESEIDAAEKTGEDVFLIDEKYAKKKQGIYEKYASDQVALIAENAAHEQKIRDEEHIMDMLALKKRLVTKQITQEEYAQEEYKLRLDYARKTTEAAIDALEQELNADNLSTEDRAKLSEQLHKLKADLAKEEAEAEIAAIDSIAKADEKAQKERIKNLQKWLQTASQAIGDISSLINAVYDGQIDKIEEEQDINDEKYEKDVERYERQAEQGAISEEEAEARKRAAKAATEAKNEELEKKKQEIAHKQAVWEKAVQVAQTGIATARGIMEALAMFPPNPVMAAMISAMGAVQVATILATPIPSYAEGTKDGSHPGGKALVGDAGKREVVMYSGKAWITPDTPTLVDLPKGAQVFPDVHSIDLPDWDLPEWDIPAFPHTFVGMDSTGQPVIFNDYSDLKHEVKGLRQELHNIGKQQHKDACARDYRYYILSRL